MATADRISLTALRKLAREALGEHSDVIEVQDGGSRWQVAAYAADCKILGRHGAKVVARRQLRDLLLSIVAGQMAGEGCTLHGDAPHGKEAEELRKGVETLIASSSDFGATVVTHRALQRLLDSINARDSLAHVRAKARAPRRRATNGAGYRRKT